MRALPLLFFLGCAPLPELITDGQIRATFQQPLHEPAFRCAARLNRHVRSAEVSGVARPVLFGSGAIVTGTGVALREIAPNAALPLAAAGAILAILSELVLRLVADPADLLSRHSRGLASWDAARRTGRAEDLERCVRDVAPEVSRFSGFAP